jgi:AcrR family transcriptional regulator
VQQQDGVPPGPGRVAAPALTRRGPGSTREGRRSRERVLRAALDLITEVGIDQVRLAEIARRAGMSSGQVMYYFDTKEHILLETLAWREYEDTERRRADLAKAGDDWARLDQFIESYLPGSRTDPTWKLWLEAWARAPHNAEVSEFLDALLTPWREDLADIVRHGAACGVFRLRGSAEDFTVRFCALLDGLAILRLRQPPGGSGQQPIELAAAAARAELAPAP